MRAFLSLHADRWLIRGMRGPSGFLGVPRQAGPVANRRTYRFAAGLQARAHARHGLAHGSGTIQVNERWRRVHFIDSIFDQLPFLASLLGSDVLLGLAFLALTAAVMASGVPGALMPISFSSGALLGGWLGMAVVVAGALLGSHALFVAMRRWLAERLRRRWGERLARFDRNMESRGFYYLLGLRLIGAPHLLVTASCSLSAIRARSFALATLLGFLPAITLAAMAGSAV
jgi:membrane protein DedA with SNARE-associated domain